MLAQPRELPRAPLEAALHRARQAVLRFDQSALEGLLEELVPEYTREQADVVSLSSRQA
jgi:hypothetical protein